MKEEKNEISKNVVPPKVVPKYKLGLKAWISPFKFNFERWMYTLHRVTAVILIVYVYMHIYVTSIRVLGGETGWTNLMNTFENPINYTGEIIVVAALAIHGANGIRLILAELGYAVGKPIRPEYPYKPSSLKGAQRTIAIILMILAGIMILFAILEYVPLYLQFFRG
jgi:succinate dehydrogenase cytochrome b556 subunit